MKNIYSTFYFNVLFTLVGFCGNFAATFVWSKLENSPEIRNYLGWITLIIMVVLTMIFYYLMRRIPES